jgi:hypothetical protein
LAASLDHCHIFSDTKIFVSTKPTKASRFLLNLSFYFLTFLSDKTQLIPSGTEIHITRTNNANWTLESAIVESLNAKFLKAIVAEVNGKIFATI